MKSYRITRTSREPIDSLNVQMNIGSAGLIDATAATADGPTFSQVVDEETGRHFLEDEGLQKHFTVEEISDAPPAAPFSRGRSDGDA